MQRSSDQLKRKLRQLRKLEIKIRFQGQPPSQSRRLVWDAFFSTQAEREGAVKYPLQHLVALDRGQLKAIVEEYFYRVYFQNYRENGLTLAGVYDPQLLSLLGLSPHADIAEIKKRFRDLAKRYHPDLGGDGEKFIELMETYERLTAGGSTGNSA